MLRNKFSSIIICGIILLLNTNSTKAQLLDSAALSQQIIYTSLEEALKNPDKVYRLNLRKKKLRGIPEDIFKFKNLQELNLNKNKIDSIPDGISKLKNLQLLDLSKNKLKKINPALCELFNLEHLILNRNYIVTLPPEIGKLKNLKYLDMWENMLEDIPGEIEELRDNLLLLDIRIVVMEKEIYEDLVNMLPDTKILYTYDCGCD